MAQCECWVDRGTWGNGTAGHGVEVAQAVQTAGMMVDTPDDEHAFAQCFHDSAMPQC